MNPEDVNVSLMRPHNPAMTWVHKTLLCVVFLLKGEPHRERYGTKLKSIVNRAQPPTAAHHTYFCSPPNLYIYINIVCAYILCFLYYFLDYFIILLFSGFFLLLRGIY